MRIGRRALRLGVMDVLADAVGQRLWIVAVLVEVLLREAHEAAEQVGPQGLDEIVGHVVRLEHVEQIIRELDDDGDDHRGGDGDEGHERSRDLMALVGQVDELPQPPGRE